MLIQRKFIKLDLKTIVKLKQKKDGYNHKAVWIRLIQLEYSNSQRIKPISYCDLSVNDHSKV